MVKDGSYTCRPLISTIPLKGNWWRVFPSTAKEVLALAMLEHRREKFAPAPPRGDINGNGVLISAEALLKLDYK
jgi:hypothetical protein